MWEHSKNGTHYTKHVKIQRVSTGINMATLYCIIIKYILDVNIFWRMHIVVLLNYSALYREVFVI